MTGWDVNIDSAVKLASPAKLASRPRADACFHLRGDTERELFQRETAHYVWEKTGISASQRKKYVSDFEVSCVLLSFGQRTETLYTMGQKKKKV